MANLALPVTPPRMPKIAVAATLLLCVLFGGDQVSRKIALAGAPPLTTGALAYTVGGILLWLYASARGIERYPKSIDVWRMHALSAGLFLLVNGIGLIGLRFTTAGRASVFNATYPLFIAALASQIGGNRESLKPAQIAGSILAFLGIIVVFSDRMGDLPEGAWRGDALLLLSSFFLAILVLHLKRVTQLVMPQQAILWQVSLSVPVFWCAALVFEGPIRLPTAPLVWAGLLYQGMVIVGFAFVARAELIRRYGASLVASFFFVTPLAGVLLGILLLGDPVTLRMISGCPLVLLGVILVQRAPAGAAIGLKTSAEAPRDKTGSP